MGQIHERWLWGRAHGLVFRMTVLVVADCPELRVLSPCLTGRTEDAVN